MRDEIVVVRIIIVIRLILVILLLLLLSDILGRNIILSRGVSGLNHREGLIRFEFLLDQLIG